MSRSAAVIGAGAAGSAAAAHLARLGWAVTVIESRAFPRSKVCGEFISPAATGLLEALIGPGDLLGAGARRVGTLTLESSDKSRTWTLPEPAWSLSRRGLDHLLLERARAAGATVLQPELVTGVEYSQSGVRVELASGREIPADIVVHADGSGRHDPAGPIPLARGLIGLKCHARATVDGVRLRAHRGGYCGAIGIEGGLSTFAMCVSARLLRDAGGDRDALLARIWPGLDPAQRVGDWHACGVARSAHRPGGHYRSFRVGNAAGAVDPVGGEGIGLALWSAATLAGLIDSTGDHARAAREYHAAWNHRLRTRLPACRLAAEALMRPALLAAFWPMLAAPALTIAPWYRLTGKPPRVARARGAA